ncbi:MAG: hypothetical protein VX323_08300, partial [Pseudomonadota bacterium]|nr:hypothetical protein [Pseudomonadota bacterium]
STAPSTMPKLVGTPEALRDTLDAYAEAGVDEFIVPDFTLSQGEARERALDTFLKRVAGR